MTQPDQATEDAARPLKLLAAQADAVRAELSQLRADLAATRSEFSKLRATELARASETLVEAATHADTVAQSVVSSLDDLNLYSHLDELTGLPTRALMLDRLDTMILTAERRGSRLGVVFLDLDGFKRINDRLGHAVGDQVLQRAARQLLSAVRESDTVSRHGGDEFILLFPELSAALDLAPMAAKLLSALEAPLVLCGEELRLSASIGIAVFPEDGTTASALLSNADAAMYCSKKSGRGRYSFHARTPSTRQVDPVPSPSTARRADAIFAEHEARLRELRAANQGLLEAARKDQEMRAHAELAHQRQIDFVAMAAHAMRTPLSVISSNASLLKREGETPAATKRVDTIEKHVRHLARLIADLLDGSMVGGGEFKLDRSELSFDAVLDASAEAARLALTSTGQSLHLARSGEPGSLSGDPMRLAQLFGNLLKNAHQRAPDGSLRFSVEREGSMAMFVIANDSACISEDSLEDIFELYTLDKICLRTTQDSASGWPWPASWRAPMEARLSPGIRSRRGAANSSSRSPATRRMTAADSSIPMVRGAIVIQGLVHALKLLCGVAETLFDLAGFSDSPLDVALAGILIDLRLKYRVHDCQVVRPVLHFRGGALFLVERLGNCRF